MPIILSPLAYIFGLKLGKKVGWFSFALLAYSTILLLWAGATSPDYLEAYRWAPIGTFGLRADGLSLPFATIIYILSTSLAIYSMPYMHHRIEEELLGKEEERRRIYNSRFGLYYTLYLIYAGGMLGTVLATNLIQFYIFFELMLIPSYFLIAEFGYGQRDRIAFMYFLWTHLGALVLLAGILATALFAGSFDMQMISEANIPFHIRLWISLALIFGLSVKLAAFGLHIWLPHAHAEAPTPISALLSPAMIGIGGYAIIRILVYLLPSAYHTAALIVSIWGLITMVYGGAMALAQDDVKRLLAYSSISQMGYIIFGIASLHYVGVSGSVFQYVSHGTGKAILFMMAGAIILQAHGTRSISKLGGLAGRMPLTASAAMLGFMTIIGIPPLNGFQAEWMLFYGSFAYAIAKGWTLKLVITAIALAATPITAGYALWTIKRVFFGPTPEELKDVKEAPPSIIIPILFLAFLGLLLGIHPSLINDRLVPALQSLPILRG